MPRLDLETLQARTTIILPGLAVAGLIAMAGQFISEHYGAPAMLMALLFGIAFNFLSEEGRCTAGIAFSAKTVLRFGIALLGFRISFELAADLGWEALSLVVVAVAATIGFGLFIGRFFGLENRFAFLSAGSVAICGASAALAIAAILPQDKNSEERLAFTVVGVTVLSTVAMVVYPILASMIGLEGKIAGIFLGATIHDVAQVVGAGFSISNETGEVATVVKLIRVALLAPVVIIATLVLRRMATQDQTTGKRPPILPFFMVAFAVLVTLTSLGLVPPVVIDFARSVSSWALLTAIAAVGLKTSLREIAKVGAPAVGLIVTQTAFIALLVLGALKLGVVS